MRGRSRQLVVVAAVAFNVIVNGLAGAGMLFGVPTGAVSDAVPTGLTPAGWTFGIWSVIFGGVVLYAVWQARRTAAGDRYDLPAGPFVVANVLNGLWQVPWLLGQLALAAVLLFGIVASLAALYVRLDRMALRGMERWVLGVPVAMWLAWTMVAAALNVTLALVDGGWAPASPLWPVAVVAAIAVVGAGILARTADLTMALVFAWAFAGIAAVQAAPATRLALAGAALVLAVALWMGRRAGRTFWPTAHALTSP